MQDVVWAEVKFWGVEKALAGNFILLLTTLLFSKRLYLLITCFATLDYYKCGHGIFISSRSEIKELTIIRYYSTFVIARSKRSKHVAHQLPFRLQEHGHGFRNGHPFSYLSMYAEGAVLLTHSSCDLHILHHVLLHLPGCDRAHSPSPPQVSLLPIYLLLQELRIFKLSRCHFSLSTTQTLQISTPSPTSNPFNPQPPGQNL